MTNSIVVNEEVEITQLKILQSNSHMVHLELIFVPFKINNGSGITSCDIYDESDDLLCEEVGLSSKFVHELLLCIGIAKFVQNSPLVVNDIQAELLQPVITNGIGAKNITLGTMVNI